eukprot:4202712-Alexandrium_andersonii.AAC.1
MAFALTHFQSKTWVTGTPLRRDLFMLSRINVGLRCPRANDDTRRAGAAWDHPSFAGLPFRRSCAALARQSFCNGTYQNATARSCPRTPVSLRNQ